MYSKSGRWLWLRLRKSKCGTLMKALSAISWIRFSWSSALCISGNSVKAPLGMDYKIAHSLESYLFSLKYLWNLLNIRHVLYIYIYIYKTCNINFWYILKIFYDNKFWRFPFVSDKLYNKDLFKNTFKNLARELLFYNHG